MFLLIYKITRSQSDVLAHACKPRRERQKDHTGKAIPNYIARHCPRQAKRQLKRKEKKTKLYQIFIIFVGESVSQMTSLLHG